MEVCKARLGLARVSVVRGEGPAAGSPAIDDYIRSLEPISDYLTKWSGLVSCIATAVIWLCLSAQAVDPNSGPSSMPSKVSQSTVACVNPAFHMFRHYEERCTLYREFCTPRHEFCIEKSLFSVQHPVVSGHASSSHMSCRFKLTHSSFITPSLVPTLTS